MSSKKVRIRLKSIKSRKDPQGNTKPTVKHEDKTKYRRSRMDIIGQNGNEGLHYDED